MAIRTKDMPQEATYWPPAAFSAEGKPTVGTAVLVAVRWQKGGSVAVDEEGREFVSSAVVYVAQEVAVGGWLALGDQTLQDPVTLAAARPIKAVMQSPNLKGTEELVKAVLK